MNDHEVVDTIIAHISKKFPKKCENCGRVYATIKQYLQDTVHTGKPISYDAEVGDWNPTSPIGSIAMSNCNCGSTLAIDSRGMSLIDVWQLLRWARKETRARNLEIKDLMEDIRNKIDAKILGGDV